MFKLFNPKSKMELLEDQYEKLILESQEMNKYNPRKAQKIKAQANAVFQEMVKIRASLMV